MFNIEVLLFLTSWNPTWCMTNSVEGLVNTSTIVLVDLLGSPGQGRYPLSIITINYYYYYGNNSTFSWDVTEIRSLTLKTRSRSVSDV